MDELLKTMAEVTASPLAYGRKLKADRGKKTVGYVCSYTPEEIIIAAGAHPFRLFGTTGEIERADAHLQSYCCSLVRGILEEGLKGGADFLDGMVFPHTCDSIQRLSDLWRMNVPHGFHLDCILPVKLTTDSARTYFIEVLRRFREDLERELSCRITDEGLQRAVEQMNELRRLLRRICEMRSEKPALLTGEAYYAIVKAAMIMDRKDCTELLAKIVKTMEEKTDNIPEKIARRGYRDDKRLFMVGGICNHPHIHQLIEDAGGVVVGDDLCTGSRYFDVDVVLDNVDGDPLSAIADRFLKRAVCPAKHAGLTNRAERIIDQAKEKRARGVIFLLLKFCDPHAFDYPYLKGALDQAGIPSLLLEVEDPLPAEGQLRTRFEAFLEMM